jgi:hypothetical protein
METDQIRCGDSDEESVRADLLQLNYRHKGLQSGRDCLLSVHELTHTNEPINKSTVHSEEVMVSSPQDAVAHARRRLDDIKQRASRVFKPKTSSTCEEIVERPASSNLSINVEKSDFMGISQADLGNKILRLNMIRDFQDKTVSSVDPHKITHLQRVVTRERDCTKESGRDHSPAWQTETGDTIEKQVYTTQENNDDFIRLTQRLNIVKNNKRNHGEQQYSESYNEDQEDKRLQARRLELLKELNRIDEMQRNKVENLKAPSSFNTRLSNHGNNNQHFENNGSGQTLGFNTTASNVYNTSLFNRNLHKDDLTNEESIIHDFISPILKSRETTPVVKKNVTVNSPFMESVYLNAQAVQTSCDASNEITQQNITTSTPTSSACQQPFYMKPRVKIPSFSGRYDKTSPFQFILEFERYARAQGLKPDEAMHRDMPCALLDDALSWWDFHQGFKSWEDFADCFMVEFCSVNYKQELWKQLEARTQDRDESLTSYIRTINNYYRFLNIPVPDAVKVQRVLDQIHPVYRKYTCGQQYANLHELAQAALKIQDAVLKEKMYRPPPDPSECVVPNLAYKKRYSRPRECDNNLSSSRESSNERGVSLEALDPFRGKMKFEKNRRRDDRGYYEPRRDLRGSDRSRDSSRERSEERDYKSHKTTTTNEHDVKRVTFDKTRCFICDGIDHYARSCPQRKQKNINNRDRSFSPRRSVSPKNE